MVCLARVVKTQRWLGGKSHQARQATKNTQAPCSPGLSWLSWRASRAGRCAGGAYSLSAGGGEAFFSGLLDLERAGDLLREGERSLRGGEREREPLRAGLFDLDRRGDLQGKGAAGAAGETKLRQRAEA